jgi:hypothetical protein
MRNPFALDPASAQARRQARRAHLDREPVLSATDDPAMRTDPHHFAVFRAQGSDPVADLGRAVEGWVLVHDWGLSADDAAAWAADFEATTNWFVLVDLAGERGPQAVGSLAVSDCLAGPSETLRAAAVACQRAGRPVPPELTVRDEDRVGGLWDVMQVSVLRPYRGTTASVWLSRAVYRCVLEAGVRRLVASMTARELQALLALGFPITTVDGLAGDSPYGLEHLGFTFQTADVAGVETAVADQIDLLLDAYARDGDECWLRLADVASVFLTGWPCPPSRRRLPVPA